MPPSAAEPKQLSPIAPRDISASPERPLSVAVVIPCFNELALLKSTVDALLNQTYLPDEILIVDDGSAEADLFDFPSHPCVKVIRQVHSGGSVARYRGVMESTAEIIVFNDAGDISRPDRIRLYVMSFMRHPECGASFSETVTAARRLPSFSRDCNRTLDGSPVLVSDPLTHILKRSWPLAIAMNFALRRDVAVKATQIPSYHEVANDYVLQLQAATLAPFTHISAVTLDYSESLNGLTQSNGPARQAAYALHASATLLDHAALSTLQTEAFRERLEAEWPLLCVSLMQKRDYSLSWNVLKIGLRFGRLSRVPRVLWWAVAKNNKNPTTAPLDQKT